MNIPSTALDTLIRKGTRLEGKISTSDTLIVEGKVDGDISAHAVVVSEGAYIKGSINANVVTVCGAVEGSIVCLKLQITSTGKARGDFTQSVLEVASGAAFEGKVTYKKNGSSDAEKDPSVSTKSSQTASTLLPTQEKS